MKVLLSALLAAGPASVSADEPTPEQLTEAAKQLGDADARVREKAAETLRAAGPAAESALRVAAEGGDPQAAKRAAALLRQIARPAIEDPPEVEPPEMGAYRSADEDAKAQIIERLATGYRATALVRLWKQEDNGTLRAAMSNAMQRAPATFATALLADGNAPAAERLLEEALDRGNAEAVAPYAALCLLRGQTAEAIAKWKGRLPQEAAEPADEASTKFTHVVLTRLYRAASDPKSAVESARHAGDPVLIEEALLDACDWPALAEAVAARQTPVVRAKQFGLLAGAHHLAGNADGFDDTIARMRQIAKPESFADVAQVLFLAGRVEQGFAYLEEVGGTAAATRLRLLAAQERWDDVSRLIESVDAARDESAMLLRVAAAELWFSLGETTRAEELLARVAGENRTPNSAAVHARLGEAYRTIGKPEESWGHFVAAIERETEAKGDPGRIIWLALRADTDGDGDLDLNGANLLEQVKSKRRDANLKAQLDVARRVVEKTMSIDDLRLLADDGRRGSSRLSFRAYATAMPLMIAQRIRDEKGPKEAEEYLTTAAERSPAPEYALGLFIRLGDWAVDEKQWGKASTAYGRAWNAERTRSAPLYLRALALREAGYGVRAGELTGLARELPLADSWRRQEAVKFLHDHGQDAALAGEVDVILRTARPDSGPADVAMRLRAERARHEGDFLAAAAWSERSMLNAMSTHELSDPLAYLRVPHNVHRLRAKGLLAKGDVAGAEKEIAVCGSLLPGDVMLPIDLVPEFERLGDKARADALYAESMRMHEAALAKYPNSANHHNNAAWLAVNCGRDADAAMAHAIKAVELKPKSAAYLDTLAEVQFRGGQFDEAIATMRKCIELEPKESRHRVQIERFEAGKRGEQRPMPPS